VDGVQQSDFDGASLVPSFDDGAATSPRDTQYFEVIGSRSIYFDGWKAVTNHVSEGVRAERERIPGSHEVDDDTWHLYDITTDFAESVDLAAAEPDRLKMLVEKWWFEAGRNQVLPLIDNLHSRGAYMDRGPYPARTQLVFRPGGSPVAEELVPPMVAGMDIAVDLAVPVAADAGLLCAQGDWTNGWALYVKDRVLHFVVNSFGTPHRVVSDQPVADGSVRLEARYRPSPPGGSVTLLVDGETVGSGRVPEDMPFRWQIGGAGLVIGEDWGFPVCDDYEVPFRWTGSIETVTMTLPHHVPERTIEDELEHVLRHE
jgi:hypothetical protein